MTTTREQTRLEYLRGELRAERISYGELSELQGMDDHIEPGDVELLEAAGVPEFDESAYVAWGYDNETDQGLGSPVRFWIAVWSDDGPQSEERFSWSREAARSIAETWAAEVGLEAVEVDEFGAVLT